MERLSKFIDLKGGIWVGLFSWIALVRFGFGLPVDQALYLGVIGIFAGSKVVPQVFRKGATKRKDFKDVD